MITQTQIWKAELEFKNGPIIIVEKKNKDRGKETSLKDSRVAFPGAELTPRDRAKRERDYEREAEEVSLTVTE